MPDYVTDTHGLIWYLTDDPRLETEATRISDACDAGAATVLVPSICMVEIIYLQEKGRIPTDLLTTLLTELDGQATGLRVTPLDVAVAAAVSRVARVDVPELPDRIIAATAMQLALPLITKDHEILASGLSTVW
jgi:PIN domain nuclease of toxin-antitoxin system